MNRAQRNISRSTLPFKIAILASAVTVANSASAQLEEVLVTATKRTASVQDIPISVSAISNEAMNVMTAGGADIRFLSARVPSLQIESSFGRTFPRFYIRGLGNTDFDYNASQPVSLIVDDVVQENPVIKGFPIFDTDRIEVLRGPQGTLFGRNSPAGIVKIDSAKPAQEFEAYVSGSYGTFDFIDVEGVINGSLTDTLSGRLSFQYQERDDWVDNTGTGDDLEGYEETAVRAQLLWEPTDQFSALLNAHGRDTDGTARVFRANIIKEGSNSFANGYKNDKVNTNGRNEQEIEGRGGVAKLVYDFGEVTLTSVTGYETVEMFSVGDIDGGSPDGPGFIPFQSTTGGGLPDLDQITQEFRLSSNSGESFNWQAGLFYFSEELLVEQFAYNAEGFDPFRKAVQEQETDAFGIFGQVDFDITDNFKIAAGLRYSEDEKDYEAFRFNLFESTTIPAVGPLTTKTKDENISWDISGTYFINDDVSVYSRIGESFRAPSVQGRLLFAESISEADTETNTSIEFGVKSEMMDNRLRVNATVFYWEMEDQQLSAVGGTANVARLLNADTTEGYGFEADVQFAATDQLRLSGGLSYNDTEIKDDEITVPVCGSPCTPTSPLNADGRAILDGHSLPQTSEWTANFNLRYSVPVANDGEVYFVTDWAYQTEVRFFLYESKSFENDPLLEGGVRLGYSHNDGQYEIAAYGRNITNEEVLKGGIDFNNLTGMVNEPRTWGVEFTARFF